MQDKIKVKTMRGIEEKSTIPHSENPEFSNDAPCPETLSPATEKGIESMCEDIGERVAVRLRSIITAAAVAGQEKEMQEGVKKMAALQISALLEQVQDIATKGLDWHFSGSAPFADNVPGCYSVCL